MLDDWENWNELKEIIWPDVFDHWKPATAQIVTSSSSNFFFASRRGTKQHRKNVSRTMEIMFWWVQLLKVTWLCEYFFFLELLLSCSVLLLLLPLLLGPPHKHSASVYRSQSQNSEKNYSAKDFVSVFFLFHFCLLLFEADELYVLFETVFDYYLLVFVYKQWLKTCMFFHLTEFLLLSGCQFIDTGRNSAQLVREKWTCIQTAYTIKWHIWYLRFGQWLFVVSSAIHLF